MWYLFGSIEKSHLKKKKARRRNKPERVPVDKFGLIALKMWAEIHPSTQARNIFKLNPKKVSFVPPLEPSEKILAKIAGSVLQDKMELWVKCSHAIQIVQPVATANCIIVD